MMMNYETENTHVLPFSGEHKKWCLWSHKFLARASEWEHKDSLLRNDPPPAHDATIDPTSGKGKKQLLSHAHNNQAYHYLLLLCMDKVSLRAIDEALIKDLLDGDVTLAWITSSQNMSPKLTPAKLN